MLVLYDGALALSNATPSEMAVINIEWLVHCVAPIEVDESHEIDHIEVLVVLLKSMLEPGNFARLAWGISDLIEDLIPLQAVLLNVATMLHLKPLFHFTIHKPRQHQGNLDLTSGVVLSCCCCLSAGSEVSHVDVTAKLILGLVLIDILELRIDAFVESAEHHRQ